LAAAGFFAAAGSVLAAALDFLESSAISPFLVAFLGAAVS